MQLRSLVLNFEDAAGASHSVVVDADRFAVRPTASAASTTISTWAAVAAACDVSPDTLTRRRREARDAGRTNAAMWGRKPYFLDLEDARRWFRALCHPGDAPRRERRRTTGAPATTDHRDGPVDWNAIARGSTGTGGR